MGWANLAAIIIIPIFAVVVGQWLQNRSEKRKDKMRVFSHLMSYRALGYFDINSVNVLNSVPIIFYKDAEVIEAHSAYMRSLNIKQEDYTQKEKEIDNNKTKMLIAMAKVLGYKNINWETIQNPYIPIGLTNEIANTQAYKNGQLEIINSIQQLIMQGRKNDND